MIATGGNSSDATYALALSTDGIATTRYLKNDGTVQYVLGPLDTQPYAAWGGAWGSYAI